MNGNNAFGNAVGAVRENKWIIAVTVMLPTLIEIIDTSVAVVALDHIRGSLSAGIDEATWILTSYLVSNAIVIPMTGWLARSFGRKRYLIFSVGLFTTASFLCGSSTSLAMLIFFRVLQGAGGGALQPISQAILLESFPPEEHGIAMAIFGVGAMFGPIVGPLLGGYVTDVLSWRWIFYVNIPFGILAIMMVGMFIHDPPYLKWTERHSIDMWGIILLSIGIGALQIVLDKGERSDWFHSDFILVLAAIALLALVLFVVIELLFAESPVVDLRVFRNIPFTAGNVLMFTAFFNLFGSIVLLPLYSQVLLGYTAFLAGLVLSPGGVATLFTMPVVGRLIVKRNPKWILAVGIVVCAYATHLMSRFNLDADFSALMWPRIYLGIGMGCLFIPLTTLTLSPIPNPQMGNATSIYNLLRNLGGSFGVAFATTIMARRTQFHQLRLTEHLTWYDQAFTSAVERGKALLPTLGVPAAEAKQTAMHTIYGQTLRQANAMGYNDAFWILSVLLACVLPLVLLLRRPEHQNGAPPPVH